MSKNKCTVVWKGEEAIAESHDILLEALEITARNVLITAKKYAPIDTGTLRRSGCVTVGFRPNPNEVYREAEKGTGEKSVIETSAGSADDELVVYVTFNTPYAAKLHEDTKWKPSPTSRRLRTNKETGEREFQEISKPEGAQGGPKYLEKAAEEHWKDFPEVVQKIARKHRKR